MLRTAPAIPVHAAHVDASDGEAGGVISTSAGILVQFKEQEDGDGHQ
ncbi:MAG: hypothetical protein M5U34_42415 [Chloroflexi bacterium]|nr:hypothetical protein [Chloroflexota bacterium]